MTGIHWNGLISGFGGDNSGISSMIRLRGFLSKTLYLSLALLSAAVPSFSQAVPADELLRSQFGFSQLEIDAVTRGVVISKVLGSANPAEVAAFGAVYIHVPVDFAVNAFRDLESFKLRADVPEIGKFALKPDLNDLKGLTLEEEDIAALRKCSPGHCAVKLSAAAMKRFRKSIDWNDPDYPDRALALMKQLLVSDVRSYLDGGNDSMGAYDDQSYSLNRAGEFYKLLAEKPTLITDVPELFAHLGCFPRDSLPGASDLIFWQKEKFEKIKPILSLTHMTIYRPDSCALKTMVTMNEIYANHYLEASLLQMALVKDSTASDGFYALVLQRFSFDDLRKPKLFDFSKEIRGAIYQQVREEIAGTKTRLESLYHDSKYK